MESLQNIKRRLKSVNNINQITKAMELVAATKMRRSQEIALASRPYAFAALDFLANLSRLSDIRMPPLLEKRDVTKTAYVVVTSDKGLAGSFNSAVIREFEKFVRTNGVDLKNADDSFVAVGQKANAYLHKRAHAVAEHFLRVGDYTTVEEVRPIADVLTKGYLKQRWDRVLVFSTHFKSALRQFVLVQQLFPVNFESLRKTAQEIVPERGKFAESREHPTPNTQHPTDYLIEPSPQAVLEQLVEHLVVMQIYHLILEANASEHAARRAAMKNASDNAGELASELTILYNKSRQAGITKELTEITAGAESLQ